MDPRRKTRLTLLFGGVVLFLGLVGFRLFQLQVVDSPELRALADKQYRKLDRVAPYRHPLYDRNREELAVSIPASSVFARPRLIRQKRKTARVLAKVLGGNMARWHSRLDTQKPFVWLHRQLNSETATKLAHQNLPGIFIEPENKRIYPNGMLASQLIGFTDIDGNGLAGLELQLNTELMAKQPPRPIPRDGRGTPTYIDRRSRYEDEAGVVLTLDRRLQHAVEEELQKATEEFSAKGAFAIVIDPYTGEIFAMAQRPSFDPGFIKQYPPTLFANTLVSHLYEPGSTIKVIFAAEALQKGILKPDSVIDCGGGQLTIGKETLGEADAHHRYDRLPLYDVIRHSSNIGAIRVVQALGADRARAALEKFGLTGKTGVMLPSEAVGSQRTREQWIPIHLATAGFGQWISVTPLQMVLSYAPFANGGYRVRPRILARDVPPRGQPSEPPILSASTVAAITKMLVGVTDEKGTGFRASVPGVKVAGKTGTAQKYLSVGGYKSGKYLSSFIGYLPAEKPELLIGIFVDEPSNGYYASQVAAPVFERIAERSLQILDRLPRRAIAGKGKRLAPKSTSPSLELVDLGAGKYKMPDLKGVGTREVLRLLGGHFPKLKLDGAGFVASQSPQPGAELTLDSPIRISLAHR